MRTEDARIPERVHVFAEEQGADLAALRANLALTPAQRLAELDAMTSFQAEVQSRTLDERLRRALLAAEIHLAERRLAEAESGTESGNVTVTETET